jgi:hypothetical protein
VSASLDNFTAPDEYSDSVGFLRCQESARVRIHVANQAIFWRRGHGVAGGGVGNWEAEEELPPGLFSLNDSFDAIQVRAAVPAAELPAGALAAQVSLSTRTAAEL